MAQVELHAALLGAGLLLADELVHVEVTDPHPAFHVALTQAGQQQLAAQFAAEPCLRHAAGFHPVAQVGHGDAVLAGDVGLGLVHQCIVHLDAGVTRLLHQGPLGDQVVQHLAGEFGRPGDGRALLAHLAFHPRHAGTHLVVGDGFGIDHRHDVVGLLRACRCGRQGQRRPGCPQALARAARGPQALGLQRGAGQGAKGGKTCQGQGGYTFVHGA